MSKITYHYGNENSIAVDVQNDPPEYIKVTIVNDGQESDYIYKAFQELKRRGLIPVDMNADIDTINRELVAETFSK